MATKRTTTKKAAPKAKPAKKAAAPKKPAKQKTEVKPQGPRHPAARVKAAHGSKEALAKAIAPMLVRGDESADAIAARLKTASNSQLLRLQRVTDAVKQKWGSREALITALGTAEKKSKDKDYLAKLATFSLPKLYDLATSAERRARA